MKLTCENYPLPIAANLTELLEQEIAKAGLSETPSVVINFRDPDYSVQRGGFHPVEIYVRQGRIQYITDFAYVGQEPFVELAKELDFDFSLGLFQQFGREFPIASASELFAIWQENFLAYVGMGVFEVSVQSA